MVVCPNDSGVWNVMRAKRSTEDLVHVIRSCHFALTLWRKFLNTIGVNVPPGGCKGTEELLVNSSFSKRIYYLALAGKILHYIVKFMV